MSNAQKLLELGRLAGEIPQGTDGWSPYAVTTDGKYVLASKWVNGDSVTQKFPTADPVWAEVTRVLKAGDAFRDAIMKASMSDLEEYRQLNTLVREFDDEEHPRDTDTGQFTTKDGSGGSSGAKLPKPKTPSMSKKYDPDVAAKKKRTLTDGEYSYHNVHQMVVSASNRFQEEVYHMNIPENELQRAGFPPVADKPTISFQEYEKWSQGENPYRSPEDVRLSYEREHQHTDERGVEVIKIRDSWYDKGSQISELDRKRQYLSELTQQQRVTADEKELSGRLTRLSKLYPDSEGVKELNRAKELDRSYNAAWGKVYNETPSFWRGTRTGELDSYLANGTVGKEGIYKFVSVSADHETARGFSSAVLVEYDGDSIREQGKRVTYTSDPVKLSIADKNYGYDEAVGKPYRMLYAVEQEARVPKGTPVKDMSIKSVYLNSIYNDKEHAQNYARKLSEAGITQNVYLLNISTSTDFAEAIKNPEQYRVRVGNESISGDHIHITSEMSLADIETTEIVKNVVKHYGEDKIMIVRRLQDILQIDEDSAIKLMNSQLPQDKIGAP